ncbi:uncharacterized protein [Nicotiana tomentosiformis]|uniref:uncharacterized protein n=1 Tax=Nicotiana tomentosiformis TaxID=4098 RepID=UPI00388CA961
MEENNINVTRNPEIQGEQPHFDDSISDTRNEGNDATPVFDGRYTRQVRETTDDDADEEHVADAVRVLQEQQAIILGHLMRQDQVMMELKRALSVDPGSSANIVQWRVLEQAKLTGSIIPTTKLLAGFNLASVTTRGEILLLKNAEGVMKTTLFEVVDGDMGYNIILGRPWLHEMKAVTSTYHQLLKFLTPEGIKQIRGDQPAAKEMNAISVSSSKGKEHAA